MTFIREHDHAQTVRDQRARLRCLAQEGEGAHLDEVTFDATLDPLPGHRYELEHGGELQAARRGAGDDRASEWVLALVLHASRKPQEGRLVAREGLDAHERRLADGEGARLVDDERVDLLEPLEGLGALEEHAGLRSAARAHHDRHRRGEPERAGTREVEGAGRGRWRRGRGRRREVAGRIGGELRVALGVAERVSRVLVIEVPPPRPLGGTGLDGHAADRIDRRQGPLLGRVHGDLRAFNVHGGARR